MIDSGEFRCGFVAVVGRPNVGKSTLVNAILGSKISIVTPKPQTTRHRILGVHSTATYQAIFVDTPGLHRDAGKAMNRLMNRSATSALMDADVILFVTDAQSWREEDKLVLDHCRRARAPVLAIMNKSDLVKPKTRLLEAIGAMSERQAFEEIIPLSARRRENLDALLGVLPRYLPASPPLFPEDMRTDRSELFQVAELVREKLMLRLHDELPYGTTVQVESIDREAAANRIMVNAVIWVERTSQKAIVIGKGGAMLKAIGRSARGEISRQLGAPVHLELWVKVRENWANSERDLQSLGFELP